MEIFKGNLFAFLGTSIFALNFISMKVLVDLLPVNLIIFLRFGLSAVFLFLILLSLKKELKIRERNDLIQLLITGFLGMSLYYLFFTNSLRFISPSLSSLICSMIPIITLVFDSLINAKKIKISTLFLFFLSIFGVYLVLDVNLKNNNLSAQLKGIALMLFGIFSWIAYTIKAENLLEKYNSILVLAYQCLFAATITFFFALDELKILFSIIDSPQLSLITANIIYISLIATALGYLFYNLGIKKLGVTVPSVYMNTMPAITIAASYFLLDSLITFKKIIGITAVITAAVLVALKERWKFNKDRL